jgi:hypothetical protein
MFELGALYLQSSTLSLEPYFHLQAILLWSFWRQCFANFLPQLALNIGAPSFLKEWMCIVMILN